MDLTWLGHACFRMRGREGIVLSDPPDPKSGHAIPRTEAGDEHLADLVLAGPAEHDRLSGHRLQAGVAGVVVGDGHQTGFGA